MTCLDECRTPMLHGLFGISKVPVSTRHDTGMGAGYGSLETDTVEESKEERARRESGLRLQSDLIAEHRSICEVDRSTKLDLQSRSTMLLRLPL